VNQPWEITYNLNPLFLLLVKVLILVFFLSEMEVHAYNSYKQIDTKNATNHDKQHEKVEDPSIGIVLGA